MAETFNCPACGGPLEYPREAEVTIRCPYCHNTVIVPGELRSNPQLGGATSSEERPKSTEPVLPAVDPKQAEAQIRELMAAQQEIIAVKLFRRISGVGLKQSKDAVEAIQAGGTLDPSQLSTQVNQTSAPVDDASVIDQAVQLIREGNKVAAIRLLRNHYDISLIVAVEAAKLLEQGQNVDIEWLKKQASRTATASVKLPGESASRDASSLYLWVLLLGFLLALIFIFLSIALR